jgi:hypothetical protein
MRQQHTQQCMVPMHAMDVAPPVEHGGSAYILQENLPVMQDARTHAKTQSSNTAQAYSKRNQANAMHIRILQTTAQLCKNYA